MKITKELAQEIIGGLILAGLWLGFIYTLMTSV